MKRDGVTVRIETSLDAREIHPEAEASSLRLTQWLRSRGKPLNTRCGGRGLCDACLVDVVEGSLRRIADGGARVSVGEGGSAVRVRACEAALIEGESVTLRVPDKSLMAFEPQVIADFRLEVPIGKQPLWPGADEPAGNRERPTEGSPLAAAIDVGTTTVAVLLIDLDTGAVAARASALNRQTHLGDDVLTRINLCMTDPSLIDRFQEAIVNETVAPLLAQSLQSAGASFERLVSVVAAGNATMLHLLLAEDPTPMGVAPFTPRFIDHRVAPMSSTDFRWPRPTDPDAAPPPEVKRDPSLHVLPGVAAYVGADLTAGVVATGMRYDPGVSLLVDVGTNGEIILKHDHKLLGCATAAGPAFEGSKLCDGVRAARGAISHIDIHRLDPVDLEIEIIGHDARPGAGNARRPKPIGVCGSAYIDFLAEGGRTGLLDPVGRFNRDATPAIGQRLIQADCHSQCFVIAHGSGREPICITEADVASLLQAKAAIAAGIVTLLHRRGLTPADVDTLYLAGGFGLHVRVPSAIACGLLPGFREDQVELVGNTSLAGAFMAAMDKSVLDEMESVAAACEIIELNLDPGFELNYIEQLSLPGAA